MSERVSDAVAILTEGRVVAQGRIDELLATPMSAWTARLNGDTDAVQQTRLRATLGRRDREPTAWCIAALDRAGDG